MKNINEKKILELFHEEMKRRFGDHLKEIILFGSRARGDHTEDSDYDCIAVFDVVSNEIKDQIDEIAGELLYQYNVVFSILPKLEEQIKNKSYNPFLMNAIREGISL